MAFKYKSRSQDIWDKTANMRSHHRVGYVKGQFRLYQTKKGENCIRILPPTWDDPEDFYKDIWVHFGVGPDNASVLCLRKMKDERCAVCEEIHIAEKQGASEEEIGQLQPKRRTLFWMIDRKDERAGVVGWGAPWTWTRDMVKVCKDRTTGEYFEIDHPEKGFDIYFDREDKSGFPDYSGFQLAKKPTSVASEFLQFIEENPIPDVLEWRTYEQVDKIFRGGAAPPPKEETQPERPKREVAEDDRRPAKDTPTEAEEAKVDKKEEASEGTAAPMGRPQREAPREEPVSGASRASSLRERFLKNREAAT